MKRRGIGTAEGFQVPQVEVRKQPTAIEPFVHMLEYPFVVCTECRFACVAGEVPSHLRTKHCHIQASERSRIARIVDSIPGITQQQDKLRSFQFLAPIAAPVQFITAPVLDRV